MIKTAKLTSKNLDKAIRGLRKQITNANPKNPPYNFLLPIFEKVISRRYRGYGRPRKSDYDYKKINWKKIFRKTAMFERNKILQSGFKTVYTK